MAANKRKRGADRQPFEDEGSGRPEKSRSVTSTSRRTSRGRAINAEDEEIGNSAANTRTHIDILHRSH